MFLGNGWGHAGKRMRERRACENPNWRIKVQLALMTADTVYAKNLVGRSELGSVVRVAFRSRTHRHVHTNLAVIDDRNSHPFSSGLCMTL